MGRPVVASTTTNTEIVVVNVSKTLNRRPRGCGNHCRLGIGNVLSSIPMGGMLPLEFHYNAKIQAQISNAEISLFSPPFTKLDYPDGHHV